MNLPIACSLNGAELRRRLAEVDDLARRSLIDRFPLDGGVRLIFRGADDLRPRLEAFVAGESQCCVFLKFELTTAGDRHVLDITGPPDALPVIDVLFPPESAPMD